MSLHAGTRLGPYEIIAAIGAGGMGEVYRARDPRIGRDVAIKVLPSSFAQDPDRLHRFQQEARSAGMLNHPNLLTIYELGTFDGSPFIVSELLEGDSLRDRIGTPLSARRAIEYAVQIARGLAAAHDKGIVHRDLKPENIFITSDGRVKILDFGLAKLKAAPLVEQSDAATIQRHTDPGTVLGTAGYMSPEQVRGDPVDHRSDIFAFGSILYEMLTGRRAFKGDSSVETLNAILKEEPPDLLETNQHIPPALDRIVRHCLEKHPEARFQSARDLAFDLEAISELSAPSGSMAARAARRRLLTVPLAIAAIAALVAGGLGFFLAARRQSDSPPLFQRMTFGRGEVMAGHFTPDGQSVVYSAMWGSARPGVFVARTEGPESRSLYPNAHLLAVSRTGELALQLQPRFMGGFRWSGTLGRVPLAGGAPREIAEGIEDADWDPAGKDLAVVRAVEGSIRLEYPIGRVLYQASGWISHPRFSPRGDMIAFIDHPTRGDDGGNIATVDLAGKKRALAEGYISAQGLAWAPDGRAIWFTATKAGFSRALHSITTDGEVRLVYTAPAVLTVEDIASDGRALLTSLSPRMGAACLAPGSAEETDLSWLDWTLVRDITPDGKLVLFDETGEGGGEGYGVYIRKTDGSPAVRLGEGVAMALSPDMKIVLAIRRRPRPSQIFAYPTGAGESLQVTNDTINHQWATWFPDGKRILFLGNEPGQPTGMYVQDVRGGAPKLILPPGATTNLPALSPDGTRVAGTDDQRRVVIQTLDGSAPQVLPDSLIGTTPIGWSSDGKSIYYYRRSEYPTRISRFDLQTGGHTLLHEVGAGPLGGVGVRITADGKYYAYSYYLGESAMYVVTTDRAAKSTRAAQ